MKNLLCVLIVLIASVCLFGQDEYYVTKQGDTIKCEVKKVFPDEIKVKADNKDNASLDADEIKGLLKGGIFFVSKQITNKKKKTFIILPDGDDREISYDQRFKVGAWGWVNVNVVIRSGNGIRFYEITELGQVNKNGRPVITTLYIDNDSLGLRSVPYLSAIGGDADKIDVINALYDYLRDNEEIEKKLSINEPWKTFNYNGVRKMIELYIGKKFTN
jgi:hypothetical protein